VIPFGEYVESFYKKGIKNLLDLQITPKTIVLEGYVTKKSVEPKGIVGGKGKVILST
jgi:hypothetical protein